MNSINLFSIESFFRWKSHYLQWANFETSCKYQLLHSKYISEAAIHGCSHKNSVLKICSIFTGEYTCQSVISVKLQGSFIEIALQHEFLRKYLAAFTLLTIFLQESLSGKLLRQTISLQIFKGCLPQVLLGPFLSTFTHICLTGCKRCVFCSKYFENLSLP